MFSVLRWVDRRAAARVDRYVANSGAVARRIEATYGREARVVYPPVDVERIRAVADQLPKEPGNAYIVVSRLVPHKRIDLAVAAFNELGLPLTIVGDGRSKERLKAAANPNIAFLGRKTDRDVAELLARSRGLILPAMEDFGITAVEAQAAGRPVIALDAGGAQESVIAGETGVLFAESSLGSLVEAVRLAESQSWDRARIMANARRFDRERFKREMLSEIETALAARSGR